MKDWDTTRRLVWLDALRLLAGLSMVGLHATTDASGQPFPAFQPDDRVFPMMIRAVLYVARTELFLLISLFLLLMSTNRSKRGYLQTSAIQSRKLIVPFLFWTLFYVLFNFVKAGYFGYAPELLNDLTSLETWVSFVVLGSVKYHMHFVPTLFALVLMYPLFKAAYRQPVLGAAVLVALVVKREADLYVYASYWGQDALPYIVRTVKIITYAGYGMAAASLLAIWDRGVIEGTDRWVAGLVMVGLALFMIKIDATWQTIETGRWPYDHTAGYWADFLMPVLLFALFIVLGNRSWQIRPARFAQYSFGIYLCHPIFLDLSEILLSRAHLSPTAQVACKIAIALPAAALLSLVLSRSKSWAWVIGLGKQPDLRQLLPLSTSIQSEEKRNV